MMAQYYEVLNQHENNGEQVQVGQFFNNLEDTQGVRYILTEEPQQQFRQQQLVVSSDQVMLVDSQPQQIQQVVLDQNQIAFQGQNQHFNILQNTDVNDQQQQQQIFYMEANGTSQVERVIVDQPVIPQNSVPPQVSQPIVLNHQLSPNNSMIRPNRNPQMPQQTIGQIRAPVSQTPVQTHNLNPQTSQIRPSTPQQTMLRTPRMPLQQQRLPNQIPQQRLILNQQQKNPMTLQMNRQMPGMQQQNSSINQASTNHMQDQLKQPAQQQQGFQVGRNDDKETDDQQMVTLSDGSSVSLAAYKKLLNEQKRNITQRQMKPNQVQMDNGTPPSNQLTKRPRNPTPMPRRVQKNPVRPPARPGVRPGPPVAYGPPQPRNMPPEQARFAINPPQQSHPQQARQYQNQLMQQRMSQQPMQQPQQQIRPAQMNYMITPPQTNRPKQQRPLPSYIPSSQIQHIIENTPVGENYSDSIRMLVLLESGEQRLITFTLPKEACTIYEILEQVQVPFTQDTPIQVTEANSNGINYIVTVGNVRNFGYQNDDEQQEQDVDASLQTHPGGHQQNQGTPLQQENLSANPIVPEPPKPPSPEPPKLIPGKLAVCSYCGITSEDFNRCTRCKRKLPDNVKSLDAPSKGIQRQELRAMQQGQHMSQISLKTLGDNSKVTPNATTKKKPIKTKHIENESVIISSDEEDDDKKTPKSLSEQLLKSLGASVTLSPITKEPSLNDIKKYVKKDIEVSNHISLTVKCRTVRIGSYRFVPPTEVIVSSSNIIIKVPHLDDKNEMKEITIEKSDIVKVLVSFSKALPVVFYYINPAVAPLVRNILGMKEGSETYFDPISEKEDSHKRITLLPEDFGDEHKNLFQQIYSAAPYNIMDELTPKEANDILIKTCPKDLAKHSLGFAKSKNILEYPPDAKGRITITTDDYMCLAQDNFLNDVIIDFYLKYLVENLPKERQDKVHVFSTFFYKRLTTKPPGRGKKSHPTETDLSAAQKRHARVQKWTKNVNLFEKDYIIVPINENAHWFLAIICFPSLDGVQTFDGQSYTIEPRQKPPKKKKITLTIGNVSVTAIKKEKPIMCEDPEMSDKDEAEGDESDLDSEDSEELGLTPTAPKPKPRDRPPIKQPCILIFDSLAGASRTRVVATLRDYLTCEHKAKLDQEKQFTKEVIKGACPKVPQQTNFTDCGLYLLQYVEQFFNDPIKDFYIPISSIKNWFEEITVTKKREDVAELIKNLMKENGADTSILPDIIFPTLNGKLVDRPELTEEDDEEEEDMFTDIEDSQMIEQEASENSTSAFEPTGKESMDENNSDTDTSPIKPSVESVSDKSDIVTQTVLLKPDIREFPIPRQTNRDTLSMLKAKRIIRHKSSDGPNIKKVKNELE